MKHKINLQVGVKSIIFNNEGKVLILKRNAFKYPGLKNNWDIPGGRIDSHETLENNLKREIKEETGLKPKILSLLAAQDIIKPKIRVVRLTYISHETSKNPKVRLSDEHTEYKWVNLDYFLKINSTESYIRAVVKDKSRMSFIKSLISKEVDRK